jgi:hypothetical protein
VPRQITQIWRINISAIRPPDTAIHASQEWAPGAGSYTEKIVLATRSLSLTPR